MRKLSMIKAELLDEYVKCLNGIATYECAIKKECVKGYISSKKIKGKQYHYLQWNENGKIKSKYIKPEHIQILEENIKLRKKYESNIKEMKISKKEIEQFVGEKIVQEYLREYANSLQK